LPTPRARVKSAVRTPPLLRQLLADRAGLAAAAKSRRSEGLTARTASADRVVDSVCPYCAVGCGQSVYVKDEKVVQIEATSVRRSHAGGCARGARRR
jgi:formate dehydrogenase major subunit